MAAIWRGVIAFGLVSIPISVNAATTSHDMPLHQYHAPDQGRIRLRRVCELDEQPVDDQDIVKGFETYDRVVILDPDDLKDLAAASSRIIEVVRFIPIGDVDPVHYEKPYILEPGRAGARPYLLLREALIRSGRAALATVTLRQRETLAILRPRGESLVMHTMRWPDEIRTPQVNVPGEAVEAELDLAMTLIDAMSGPFEPEAYSDDYQQGLQELVEAKLKGEEIPHRPVPVPTGQVINLMEALQKSVEQKAKRPAKKSAKKTTARKRAPAKKTPTGDER
jgi:DNA end-binding protein Ku